MFAPMFSLLRAKGRETLLRLSIKIKTYRPPSTYPLTPKLSSPIPVHDAHDFIFLVRGIMTEFAFSRILEMSP